MSKFHSTFVSFGRVQVSDIFKSKLFKYAANGKAGKIEQLVSSCEDKSYDIDSRNTRGQSPLFVASMLGNFKVVQTLLMLGANPNRRSDDGSTPVHAAAFSCVTCVLQVLCEYGGDLRFHDNRDLLPRDWAVEAGTKKNKKILELIDLWQNEILSKIDHSKSCDNIKKATSAGSSVTKMLRRSTISKGSQNESIFNHDHVLRRGASSLQHFGYGDFSAINTFGQVVDNLQQQELGYSSIIPIINSEHLQIVADDQTNYQSIPHFQLIHGNWANQPITMKTGRETKRRILRHMTSTRDLLIRELQVFSVLRHPNIITLLGCCLGKSRGDKNSFAVTAELLSPHSMIFERINFGSLYSILHENKHSNILGNRLTLTSLIQLLIQISNALAFLHQRGYIHCCVTSHAINLVNLNTAKLSDFYHTVNTDDNSGIASPISSSFNRWLAPELLANKPPTTKCDVYSFSVVVVETTTGVLPWNGYDVESVRHQVVSEGKMFPLPEQTCSYFENSLKRALCISRRKRSLTIHQMCSLLKNYVSNGSSWDYGDATMKTVEAKDEDSFSFKSLMLGVDEIDAAPFACNHQTPVTNYNSNMLTNNNVETRIEATAAPTTTAINTIGNHPTLTTDHQTPFPGPTARTPTPLQPYQPFADQDRRNQSACGDHLGDESAGLVHPALMDTDSFDSSLAESYGYYRRSESPSNQPVVSRTSTKQCDGYDDTNRDSGWKCEVESEASTYQVMKKKSKEDERLDDNQSHVRRCESERLENRQKEKTRALRRSEGFRQTSRNLHLPPSDVRKKQQSASRSASRSSNDPRSEVEKMKLLPVAEEARPEMASRPEVISRPEVTSRRSAEPDVRKSLKPENLRQTVDRVHTSLVELSHLFPTNRADDVTTAIKSSKPSRSELPVKRNMSDFFNEVISAAGIDDYVIDRAPVTSSAAAVAVKTSLPVALEEEMQMTSQKNISCDHVSVVSSQRSRRFSLTPDDLEDIFASFADRQRILHDDDDDVTTPDDDVTAPPAYDVTKPPAYDVTPSYDDVKLQNCDSKCEESSEAPMTSQSSIKSVMTSSSTLSQAPMTSSTANNVIVHHSSMNARSPPLLRDFIARSTARLSSSAPDLHKGCFQSSKHPASSRSTKDQITQTEELPKMLAPSVSLEARHVLSLIRRHPVIPASHVAPLRDYEEPLALPDPASPLRRSSKVCSDVTPSRWSFGRKLKAFESAGVGDVISSAALTSHPAVKASVKTSTPLMHEEARNLLAKDQLQLSEIARCDVITGTLEETRVEEVMTQLVDEVIREELLRKTEDQDEDEKDYLSGISYDEDTDQETTRRNRAMLLPSNEDTSVWVESVEDER